MSYLASNLNDRTVLSDQELDLLYDQEDLLNYLNEFADSGLLDHDV